MVARRYRGAVFEFEFDRPIVMSHRIEHQYGTVLAGLCWITYGTSLVAPEAWNDLASSARNRRR
jgi:hypothetical protein